MQESESRDRSWAVKEWGRGQILAWWYGQIVPVPDGPGNFLCDFTPQRLVKVIHFFTNCMSWVWPYPCFVKMPTCKKYPWHMANGIYCIKIMKSPQPAASPHLSMNIQIMYIVLTSSAPVFYYFNNTQGTDRDHLLNTHRCRTCNAL